MDNINHQLNDKNLLKSVVNEFEAKIGGALFGKTDKNCQRKFYCQSKDVWIWKEEWLSKNNIKKTMATTYLIDGNRIIKSNDKKSYRLVSANEANRLLEAAKAYKIAVDAKLYYPLLNYL